MSEIDVGGTIGIVLGSLFAFFLISCAGIVIYEARREENEESEENDGAQNNSRVVDNAAKRPHSQAYVTLPGGNIAHVPFTKTTEAEKNAIRQALEKATFNENQRKQKQQHKEAQNRRDSDEKQRKAEKKTQKLQEKLADAERK